MRCRDNIPRIPDAILTARIPVTALRLWLAIRKCQGDNDSAWWPFNHYAKMIGVNAQQVSKHLAILEEKGYIKRLPNRHIRCLVPEEKVIQTDNSELSKQTTDLSKQTNGVVQTDKSKLSKQTSLYNPVIKPTIKPTPLVEEGAASREKDKIPYSEIITDLNQRTGKQFRPSSKATQRFIRARWKEGYRLSDFQHVNRVKTQEWKGTARSKYLRPETLYSATHFESYLNDGNAAPKEEEGIAYTSSLGHRVTGLVTGEEWMRRRGLTMEDKT